MLLLISWYTLWPLRFPVLIHDNMKHWNNIIQLIQQKPRFQLSYSRCDMIETSTCPKAISAKHRPTFCNSSPSMVTSTFWAGRKIKQHSRRYIAGILPIRCKTQNNIQPTNRWINFICRILDASKALTVLNFISFSIPFENISLIQRCLHFRWSALLDTYGQNKELHLLCHRCYDKGHRFN